MLHMQLQHQLRVVMLRPIPLMVLASSLLFLEYLRDVQRQQLYRDQL